MISFHLLKPKPSHGHGTYLYHKGKRTRNQQTTRRKTTKGTLKALQQNDDMIINEMEFYFRSIHLFTSLPSSHPIIHSITIMNLKRLKVWLGSLNDTIASSIALNDTRICRMRALHHVSIQWPAHISGSG